MSQQTTGSPQDRLSFRDNEKKQSCFCARKICFSERTFAFPLLLLNRRMNINDKTPTSSFDERHDKRTHGNYYMSGQRGRTDFLDVCFCRVQHSLGTRNCESVHFVLFTYACNSVSVLWLHEMYGFLCQVLLTFVGTHAKFTTETN